MKKIIGSSFFDLMKYGEEIYSDIKRNDIVSLERKVETKSNNYVTVLFFQRNFMILSAALFSMMISWIFIAFTIIQIANIKNAPAIHFSMYIALTMPYMFIYIGSVFLLARGIPLGLRVIYLSFIFIVIMACIFSIYYSYKLFSNKFIDTIDMIHVLLMILPLFLTRFILNTELIRTAIVWTINERARKAYLKLFLLNYQSPRKKKKLRVG